MTIAKGDIGRLSTYQKGDMFVHKKHGFVVRITGAGEWRDKRKVIVIKGEVPLTVIKSIGAYCGGYGKSDGYGAGFEMTYSTCSLGACFTRLGKAGRILFGD